MYDAGADVVYARRRRLRRRRVRGGQGRRTSVAIGVDSDQYQTGRRRRVQDVILTSMLKRVDVAVFDFVEPSPRTATSRPAATVFDLKADGVGYSTSGGRSTTSRPSSTSYKQQIIDGEITVPTDRSS